MRIVPKAGLLATMAICLLGCSSLQAETQVTHRAMPGLNASDLPFSSAVQVGDVLYLSGSLGNVPGTMTLVEGGIAAETRQTMENIKAMVLQFGSSMDRVAKCTVFLADMAEWGEMNAVYRTFFTKMPARSALGASGLALDARVEIECIAVVG